MRVINPQIEGIMQSLSVSPDRKYCVSYSNNDQIVICNIISGDVKVLNRYTTAPPPPPPETKPTQQKGPNKNVPANKNVQKVEKQVFFPTNKISTKI